MTKKDYELIADWAAYCKDMPLDLVALEILATKLEGDNPKFDRDKFLTACGVTNDSQV